MCGVSCAFGPAATTRIVRAMMGAQRHRGPDAEALWESLDAPLIMGHNRLSIIDLSRKADQPMQDAKGQCTLIMNGEIYNYRELRKELHDYPYRTTSDTEVLLAAYMAWGEQCFERLIGMFSCLLWDKRDGVLRAIRDRFGVKPLYYARRSDIILFASEIKALHTAGVPRECDEPVWATWLATGKQDFPDRTFWKGISPVPAGHLMRVSTSGSSLHQWYRPDSPELMEYDTRQDADVMEEYRSLLMDTVSLRFRSDVPVGVNLSGGVDSSLLLTLIKETQQDLHTVSAYTFTTGDSRYDELPWVSAMVEKTGVRLHEVRLSPDEVPKLAEEVARFADEPYGGLPTIAYAKLFDHARKDGTIVLLDGQGMDEQWAGYDYYQSRSTQVFLQGASDPPLRPECLLPEFSQLTIVDAPVIQPFPDRLRNLQYRDAFVTKIPRTLRFNDRISMRSSTELREPFLDHRLFALAFRQPEGRKIRSGKGKWLLRSILAAMSGGAVSDAPKRPLQTPQREWLRGPLRSWATDMMKAGLHNAEGWVDRRLTSAEIDAFMEGTGDNSYYIWQWITLGMTLSDSATYSETSI